MRLAEETECPGGSEVGALRFRSLAEHVWCWCSVQTVMRGYQASRRGLETPWTRTRPLRLRG